jgi:flagellar hook-basal body complex protein FliE
MVTKIADAAAAYAKNATGLGQGLGPVGGSPARDGGASGAFTEMLDRSLDNAVKVGRDSDKASLQSLTGESPLNNIVLSTTNAELVLQTVVSIRDRIVGSMQEIMRMPI